MEVVSTLVLSTSVATFTSEKENKNTSQFINHFNTEVMKNKMMMALLCLMALPSTAQKVIEKHIDFSQKKSVSLDMSIADSISIHTWNKPEVYVKALVNINNNRNNDDYQTTFNDSGTVVTVKASFPCGHYYPNDSCNTDVIIWNVYLPEETKLWVKTINGNILVAGNTAGIKVQTVSGFIDIVVPSEAKADIKLGTISGTIYSNHEFALNQKRRAFFPKVSEKLNGGGRSIDLETVSGNIYVRK